jgi:hypothetical protein
VRLLKRNAQHQTSLRACGILDVPRLLREISFEEISGMEFFLACYQAFKDRKLGLPR